MDQDAQTVLITAGGSGIGRAIAEKFLEAGARVYVCDISRDAIQTVRADLPTIRGCLADVSVQHDMDRVFEDVDRQLGRLDVLVNNAGIGGPRAAIEDISDEDWEQSLAVNITGAFRATRHAAKRMKAAGSGCVINISTASVRTFLPHRAPYIASKQALMGLTGNLARELGPFNIRCNAILPGLIDNPRGRALVEREALSVGKSLKEVEASWLNFVSMRCWIDPAEVGDLAVFLASDRAKHITGQYIGVCGGAEWES